MSGCGSAGWPIPAIRPSNRAERSLSTTTRLAIAATLAKAPRAYKQAGASTMWDVQAALKHLNGHAHKGSLGKCARYVREAVEAGGVKLVHHVSAKDYGSSLTKVGFKKMGALSGGFHAGDVAIIQPIPHHPHGHICMYNGHNWVSDFKQLHGFYPGASYRKIKPSYEIYRHPGIDSPTAKSNQAEAAAGRGQA
jgi:hypothetical protein